MYLFYNLMQLNKCNTNKLNLLDDTYMSIDTSGSYESYKLSNKFNNNFWNKSNDISELYEHHNSTPTGWQNDVSGNSIYPLQHGSAFPSMSFFYNQTDHLSNMSDFTEPQIYKMKFNDFLVGNTFYFTSCHPNGKEILKQNIFTLKISLERKISEDKSEDLSDYIYGKCYRLISDGVSIHRGYLSYKSIFPVMHVPLHLVINRSIDVVIESVVEDAILSDENLDIVFTLTKSNVVHQNKLLHNINQFGYSIQWTETEYNNAIIYNELCIASGICGLRYCDGNKYPENFVKKNSTMVRLKNGASIIKINSMLEHFSNKFCCSTQIQEGCTSEYEKYLNCAIFVDTLRFADIKCQKNHDFYIPQCDTFTNVFIETHHDAKLLQLKLMGNLLEFTEINYESQPLLKRYKINNYNNICHCKHMSTNCLILEMTFNKSTKINIMYDRGSTQIVLRKEISLFNAIPTSVEPIDLSCLKLKSN